MGIFGKRQIGWVLQGTEALATLAAPLDLQVVTSLAEEPRALGDLSSALGEPPPTTVRNRLRRLTNLGIVERVRARDFPRPTHLRLTAPGRDLLVVADALQSWLAAAPSGSLHLGCPPAQRAINALTGGWQSNILRVIASRPLTLGQLHRALPEGDYPSHQRKLAALRETSQVSQVEESDVDAPKAAYALTAWGRVGVSPLVAGLLWEAKHGRGRSVPIRRDNAETALLLIAPLIHMPPASTGSCRLVIEAPREVGGTAAAATLAFADGAVASVSRRDAADTDAWLAGSASDWLAAIHGIEPVQIKISGDHRLATSVLRGLQGFGSREASPLPA